MLGKISKATAVAIVTGQSGPTELGDYTARSVSLDISHCFSCASCQVGMCGFFLPLGTSAEGVMSLPPSVRPSVRPFVCLSVSVCPSVCLSVCLSVCPSVHFWLVCVITRHIFNLWAPNLHQLCIWPTYRLLSKMGSIDLDLQGHSGL